MKRTTTIFPPLLLVAMAVAVFVLGSIGREGFGVWQWGLVLMAVLLSALLVGASLNFAVFAPVYWLIGRLHSKRCDTGISHGHKS
jgi:hypothetical protein